MEIYFVNVKYYEPSFVPQINFIMLLHCNQLQLLWVMGRIKESSWCSRFDLWKQLCIFPPTIYIILFSIGKEQTQDPASCTVLSGVMQCLCICLMSLCPLQPFLCTKS